MGKYGQERRSATGRLEAGMALGASPSTDGPRGASKRAGIDHPGNPTTDWLGEPSLPGLAPLRGSYPLNFIRL